ncbi:nuclease-related domain-containing protein [Marinobacter sp. DY40_1A1]|uniref:nuclease-related domain-containing protein n=1 Tax=Marinobacter sp. DY40_1A1 TaxID=2583229 RepID=UPI00190474DB|nr:nuclease-related domain-containing protein [Marinobacter sp. DY40_1A1]MBK1885226.1 NERD domain-containing protein [Marinobacter sp. DY40_1A1]
MPKADYGFAPRMMDASPCTPYYEARWSFYAATLGNAASADECLHDFLDGKPAGKYSRRERAAALLCLDFWWHPSVLKDAKLPSVGLSQVLWVLDEIDNSLLDHLAQSNPEILRWAIRHSKLFTRTDSKVLNHLKSSTSGPDWSDFFSVCDLLLKQFEPFDQLIEEAEKRLKPLSLLDLLSYLSILAYSSLDKGDHDTQQEWAVYERIIHLKLLHCSERDFQLTEKTLGKSLKHHLSPLLFPGAASKEKCITNLESVAVLVSAMKERLDYEATVDAFSFDNEVQYQWKPGHPVTFRAYPDNACRWQQTEEKTLLLWHYWLRRAVDEFVASGMAGSAIGNPENHEANQLAWIKAIRGRLIMQTVFGFSDKIALEDGAEVDLHQVLLASELSSAFFSASFLEPYRRFRSHTDSTISALGALAFEGMLAGENRFPMTWSELPEKIRRIRSWTVSRALPKGSPAAAKAILAFWTVDLRQLSAQMKSNPHAPAPKLHEQPFHKIGRYSFQFPWVVGQQNNLVAAINTLRRVGVRRPELRNETARVENRLAEALRSQGFSVVVGYQPPVRNGDDAGEIDLICHLDGVILLLEVKSGFIRSSKHEVWMHRTNTLRKAARQLRRKRHALETILLRHPDASLKEALKLPSTDRELTLHSWIVDTSIECDGESIDNFRIVSREVLEFALKDQKHYLQPLDTETEPEPRTLYPAGFSAQAFVDVITGEVTWEGLLTD